MRSRPRHHIPLLFLLALPAGGQSRPADLLIHGGTVVDGTGAPPRRADLLVQGHRIVAVQAPEATGARDARDTIDARGLVVAPGFIDVHAHISTIHEHPQAEQFIRQGITTMLATLHSQPMPWPLAKYMATLRSTVNTGWFAGHTWIRTRVMGTANRAPTADEAAHMAALVDSAMLQGAMGLATGLEYIPAAYATTGEVTALAHVAARHGGIYVTHMRDEGEHIDAALAEVLAIARVARLPAQINHLKVTGAANFGRMPALLARLDSARRAGVDVTADTYPYTAYSTYSDVFFPPWALADGLDSLRARVARPALRARLRREMAARFPQQAGDGPASITFRDLRAAPAFAGRTLAALLQARGRPVSVDAAVELLIELQLAGGFTAVVHAMSDADVEAVIRDSTSMLESDGDLVRFGEGTVHPRSYGSFPRVLAHYVRERRLLTLPEAIHRMTGRPAQRFGLRDRGVVRVGALADLTVFDSATIADRATFAQGHQYATGVQHVVVNGTPVLRDGRLTGALPGRALVRDGTPGARAPGDTVPIRSGTWVSVDLARDGRTLVFDLLGDIWRLPLSGGTAVPLTTGPAFESQPRVSPDGALVAWVSDASGSDNIWVAGLDGRGARQVSRFPSGTVVSPAWSADGRSVVATLLDDAATRTADLWRIPLDSGDAVRILANENGPAALLVSAPSPGPYSAFPTSDGQSVLLTSVTPRAYGARAGGSSRLQRLDLRTGRTEPLPVAQANPMRPMLSPDGRTLLYIAQHEGRPGLVAVDRTSGTLRWLRHPLQMHALEARASRDVMPGYAISADSRTVVLHDAGQFHRIDIATGRSDTIPFTAPVAMPARTLPQSLLRMDTGAVAARLIHHLTMDGSGEVALATLARVMIVDPRGRARRLTTTARPRELQAAWAPDGRQVAFTTWDQGGGALWVARADGRGMPRRLTTGTAWYSDPAWSPDGRELAVLRTDELLARTGPTPFTGNATLLRVDVASGTTTVVADVGALRHPVFVEAGRRLALAHGTAGIVSIARDGSDRRTHAQVARTLGRVTDVALSPAGTEVAVLAGGRLWRAPLAIRFADTTTAAIDPAAARLAPLTTDDPESVGWSSDGRTLLWSTGMVVHRHTTTHRDSLVLTVTVPRQRGRGVTALRGVRAVTMRGDEVIPDADIVITDDRITAVGARGTIPIPATARVLTLPGRTVIPGLVDVHAHWFTRPGLLEPDAPAAWANLAFGTTTVRDPQALPEIFGLADLADAGEMPAPRILSTGPGVFTDAPIHSLEDARRLIRRYRDRYRTRYLKAYLVPTRQQRQWLLQAAREAGMLVTTEGGADTRLDLTHAADGFAGNEHAIPSTPLGDDVVQYIARSGIAYTPTLLVGFGGPLRIYDLLRREAIATDPRLRRFSPPDQLQQRSATSLLAFREEDYPTASLAADATRILRAGGLVALGGHGEMQGLQNHWELRLLTEGGMTPHEALRVGTLNGAHALGLDADIGSIEVGKLADLVILDRNPLEDIRATTSIHAVMRGGELFDGTTLARRLPTPDSLPTPWWHRTDPASPLPLRVIEARVQAELDRQQIPGAAITVVRHGQTLLARGFGLANVEQGTPATDATMFQSGSLGKMFTAAGIMALVEDGRVALDSSIRRYLPDAPATWQGITVRTLLSHTSGVPDYTSERFDYRGAYTDGALDSLAFALPPEFAPGVRWNYSNTGYVLLGHLITRVTGRPYWEWLRTRIFTPAGMPTARIISESAIVPHRAAGYLLVDGAWQHQRWVSPELNVTADGSLLLSARDLAAWSRTVQARAVLSPGSWALMLSPVRLASGASYPYGFGWFIDSIPGQVVHQHGGSWQGFRTQFTHWTRDGLAISALINSGSGNPDALVRAVASAIDSALVPGDPATAIRDTSPTRTATAARVLGRIADGSVTPADFAYFRQTVFPRMRTAYGALLRGLGPPTGMDLLAERRLGDDLERSYRARWPGRTLRATLTFGPTGGLTGILLRPDGP